MVREVLTADKRILNDPAPFIALHALDASSVNVVVRVWVESSDYWGVLFRHKQDDLCYVQMRKASIFPFPQLTVHQAPN